ncbi:MAG: hypothetical protein Q4P31_06620 [Andreesenia angusta]|nr:hypothetical protein [Andreesenia angusta]
MKGNKLTKILIAISVLMIIGVSIYGIVSNSNKKSALKLEKYTIPSKKYIFINGIVKPKSVRVYETNPVKGELDSINFKDGDQVNPGDILISYRNQEVINQIAELGHDIEGLRTNKANEIESRNKQIKKLETQRANMIEEAKAAGQPIMYSQLPSTELDTPMTDYDSQIAKIQRQIEGLRSKAYETEVTDIGGKISIENISGAQGNQKRITVRNSQNIISGKVKEKDLNKIREGMTGKSVFVASNKSYDSKIESVNRIAVSSESIGTNINANLNGISPQQDTNINQNSEYEVIIVLDKDTEDLIDGFHVQTKIPLEEENEIKLPKKSVIEENSKKYVFLIGKDNKLKKRQIFTKGIEGESLIVKSGLKEKDVIVKNPNPELKEGDIIE